MWVTSPESLNVFELTAGGLA